MLHFIIIISYDYISVITEGYNTKNIIDEIVMKDQRVWPRLRVKSLEWIFLILRFPNKKEIVFNVTFVTGEDYFVLNSETSFSE